MRVCTLSYNEGLNTLIYLGQLFGSTKQVFSGAGNFFPTLYGSCRMTIHALHHSPLDFVPGL
jgi:hypothetical protein